MKEHPTGEEHELIESPPRGRRLRWVALGAVAVVVVGALADAQLGSGDDDQRVEVASPPLRPGVEVVGHEGGDDDEIRRSVQALLDPSLPVVRAARFVKDDRAESIVAALRAASAAAGVSTETPAVTVERVGTDVAVATASIVVDGMGLSGQQVLLRNIVVVRDGSHWLVTGDSACGLANAAVVAEDPACRRPSTLRRTDGPAESAAIWAEGVGAPIEPVLEFDAALFAGPVWWTDAGALVIDYPAMGQGGGGPIGPAEVVRLDPATGAVAGRVALEGSDAQLRVADGAAWVLHRVDDRSSRLARIELERFVLTGEVDLGSLASDLQVVGSTAWVVDGAALVRVEGVVPKVRGRVDLGPDGSEWRPVAATSDEVVVARDGAPDLRVDARTLAVQQIDLPPGRVIGSWSPSVERLWFVGADGSLARWEGGVLAPTPTSLPADAEVSADSAGGLWATTSLAGGGEHPSMLGSAMSFDATRRPVAVHVGADGRIRSTAVAVGGRGADALGWFSAVGERATFSSGPTLVVLPGD